MNLDTPTTKPAAERSVTACNFRASGLLSNESVRQLRSMHETLARMLSHALDLSLGSPLEVKLLRVDQVGARECAAALSPNSYLVPFGVDGMQERVIAKFESSLLCPLLDLLLGGSGDPFESHREMTEIDEELFRTVTELMCLQLERAWKGLNVTVAPLPSIKPAVLGQMFAAEDRVVSLEFEIKLGGTESSFTFLVPMTLASALVRTSQSSSTRRGGLAVVSTKGLHARLLNCRMRLAVELPYLKVPLGELIALECGRVLNLRVPVQSPIHLRVGSHSTFDVVPVRCGEYKAAQLLRARSEEVQG